MTDPKEPRRFEMFLHDDGNSGWVTAKELTNQLKRHTNEKIHVIEFSAYQALQSELDKVKSELQKQHIETIESYSSELRKADDKLAIEKAKSERLYKCLIEIVGTEPELFGDEVVSTIQEYRSKK